MTAPQLPSPGSGPGRPPHTAEFTWYLALQLLIHHTPQLVTKCSASFQLVLVAQMPTQKETSPFLAPGLGWTGMLL